MKLFYEIIQIIYFQDVAIYIAIINFANIVSSIKTVIITISATLVTIHAIKFTTISISIIAIIGTINVDISADIPAAVSTHIFLHYKAAPSFFALFSKNRK